MNLRITLALIATLIAKKVATLTKTLFGGVCSLVDLASPNGRYWKRAMTGWVELGR